MQETEVCPQHPNERLEVLCVTCSARTCVRCQIWNHEGHKYVPVEKAFIQSGMFSMSIGEYSAIISARKRQLEERKSTLKNEFEFAFLDLQICLSERKEELHALINKVLNNKIVEAEKWQEKIEALQAAEREVTSSKDVHEIASTSGPTRTQGFKNSKADLKDLIEEFESEFAYKSFPKIEIDLSGVDLIKSLIKGMGHIRTLTVDDRDNLIAEVNGSAENALQEEFVEMAPKFSSTNAKSSKASLSSTVPLLDSILDLNKVVGKGNSTLNIVQNGIPSERGGTSDRFPSTSEEPVRLDRRCSIVVAPVCFPVIERDEIPLQFVAEALAMAQGRAADVQVAVWKLIRLVYPEYQYMKLTFTSGAGNSLQEVYASNSPHVKPVLEICLKRFGYFSSNFDAIPRLKAAKQSVKYCYNARRHKVVQIRKSRGLEAAVQLVGGQAVYETMFGSNSKYGIDNDPNSDGDRSDFGPNSAFGNSCTEGGVSKESVSGLNSGEPAAKRERKGRPRRNFVRDGVISPESRVEEDLVDSFGEIKRQSYGWNKAEDASNDEPILNSSNSSRSNSNSVTPKVELDDES